MNRIWLIAFVGVLSFVVSLRAEEWTEFRGPNGDGHSSIKDLPTQWSETDNVAWRIEVPGKGWSSPVYFKQRLYLTTAVPVEEPANGQSLRTLCYEAQSGELVWDKQVFVMDGKRSAKIHGKNSYASPTPLIDGKRIFVHFGTHGTACLDLEGKILWKNEELIYAHVHGSGGSPVLVDNKLIVSCDGSDVQFVVALNADTGKIEWKTPRSEPDAPKKFAFTTPLVLTQGSKTQVVSPGPGAVCGYDVKTGKEIWKVKYDGYSVIPKPLFAHGLIYVCTGYDRPSLLAIKPDGKGDVSDTHIAWKIDKNVPHSASLLLVDKQIYMVSDKGGVLTCVDAVSGDKLWEQRLGGDFSSSPIYADGHIFLLDEAGLTTIIKPGRSYNEVAKNSINEKTQASYALGDGALFIRGEKSLFRIQAN